MSPWTSMEEGVDMKIYISCDMEGTSGIWRGEQCNWGSPHYQHARGLMMADVNAAIAGAFDGGASEVVVCDMHGGGSNFLLDQMDSRAIYETSAVDNYLPSLDSSFDGLILTGHHAKAGTLNGFLDHTMNGGTWFSFKINGQEVSEAAMQTAHAGHFDVPLIMITGDVAACEEMVSMFPEIISVPVKQGLGRSMARCLSMEKAHDMIQQGATEAVQKAHSFKPWKLDPPITLDLTFTRCDHADQYAAHFGERIDARTIRRVVQKADEVIRF